MWIPFYVSKKTNEEFENMNEGKMHKWLKLILYTYIYKIYAWLDFTILLVLKMHAWLLFTMDLNACLASLYNDLKVCIYSSGSQLTWMPM